MFVYTEARTERVLSILKQFISWCHLHQVCTGVALMRDTYANFRYHESIWSHNLFSINIA